MNLALEKPQESEAPAAPRVGAAPPSGKRRPKRWQVGAALLALIALGALAWSFLRGGDTAATGDLVVATAQRGDTAATGDLVVATAQRGDIEATVTAVGNLQPRDYVDVGAQVSGQIDDIKVEIGDQVAAGDLLVTIDPDVQQSRVDSASASLTALKASLVDRKAQLDLRRSQYDRERRLNAEGATSEDSLETARTGFAAAEAQVKALEAQIAQSESSLKAEQTTLAYTRITAPMAGTVVSINAKVGQTINASQQAPVILRIADLSTMTVWTQVSEADVARLEPGMQAYFTTLGDTDKRYKGTLRQILPTPEILNNVVLYTALFDVPNPDGRLLTQMTAQVFFITASAQNVLIVPAAAVRPARGPDAPRGAMAVRVVQPNGSQERRIVETGATDRVNVEIVSGLTEGEKVVAGRTEGTGPARSSGNSPLAGGGPRRGRF